MGVNYSISHFISTSWLEVITTTEDKVTLFQYDEIMRIMTSCSAAGLTLGHPHYLFVCQHTFVQDTFLISLIQIFISKSVFVSEMISNDSTWQSWSTLEWIIVFKVLFIRHVGGNTKNIVCTIMSSSQIGTLRLGKKLSLCSIIEKLKTPR